MEFEIVVIDSGSFDGVGEMLQKGYPQVRFIQSDRNLGFAKANNAAFNVASGRNILFLNPDTEIEGTAVETMSLWLDSMPSTGIVGAKLLNSVGVEKLIHYSREGLDTAYLNGPVAVEKFRTYYACTRH